MQTLSIIIITLNEAENVCRLLEHLQSAKTDRVVDVLLVDGGSTDDTCGIAATRGATILESPRRGRAAQMNYGAKHAKGDVLYFVHADSLPPLSYVEDIFSAVENGFPIGCYRFAFDSDRLLLKVNSYFTRFDKMWCRGGDQTLFITRQLFEDLNGYDENYQVMEEYNLIGRARESHPFLIIPKDVLVSARKYEQNSYLKVQLANLIVFNMYRFGCSQQRMKQWYKRVLGVR
ncbi:MAG: TIGR04283 family arsenosugar biosynthesis glycosyltransferase [Saprospiraceae bacterium]